MSDFVIGERRRVARVSAQDLPAGFALSIPGVRSVEIIDVSAGGARIQAPAPLRPGRPLTVRYREGGGAGDRTRPALVVRCWVCRLSRAGVTYESGLQWT